jgi:NAD(P)-dependent dehydrogenase (short-subunit alcohol dehydrogenase family)
MSSTNEKTTIVVGASRGLGRGIATAFAKTGVPVVAVARPTMLPLPQQTWETFSVNWHTAD